MSPPHTGEQSFLGPRVPPQIEAMSRGLKELDHGTVRRLLKGAVAGGSGRLPSPDACGSIISLCAVFPPQSEARTPSLKKRISVGTDTRSTPQTAPTQFRRRAAHTQSCQGRARGGRPVRSTFRPSPYPSGSCQSGLGRSQKSVVMKVI
uniref:Uncharacterized protein n=1 Tax=Knipowitschia caucasica TaxID=637954 RepID=A0AAV2MGY6_KNICA